MDKRREANSRDQFLSTDRPPNYLPIPTTETSYQAVPQYVVAQSGLPPKLYPHSFLIFSIFVSIFCGLMNIFSLFCSIPAVTLSIVSFFSSRQGKYSRGKTYGNVAAGLSIGAILFGLVLAFVGSLVGVFFTTYLFLCGGFTGQQACTQDIWGLPDN